eukprot:COSAG01_NODE_52173_length_348_cov_1.337349_1_plen_65_part_10
MTSIIADGGIVLTVAACDHVYVSQVRARLRELVCGLWPWARVAVSQEEAAAAAAAAKLKAEQEAK